MKVLLISSDASILDPGSTGHINVRNNALAIGELHVLLVTTVTKDCDFGSLLVHAVTGGGLFGAMQAARKAHALVAKHGIEAVWTQDVFERGALGVQVAKKEGIPLYVNVDTDFLSPWYAMSGIFRSSQVRVPAVNRKRRKLASQVLPRATGIRVMSERVKDSLVKKYGAQIVTPVVIPIATAPLPEAVPLPPHAFTFSLIVAGRLDAARRVVDVLDALARIKDRYPGTGLFVVGDGPERASLERHARRLHLTNRVLFLGDRRDTWGLIRSAHVYIQASAYEGYGRRLLQAALARIPIITTDVGIVGEVFKGYDDVLAMPPGDPAALATHIMGLTEDGQARQLLAMNAEAAAKRHIQAAGNIPERIAAFIQTSRVSA